MHQNLTAAAILRDFAPIGPMLRRAILEHMARDSCVGSTYAAKRVAHNYGYRARPLPVTAYVLNRALVEHVESAGWPATEAEALALKETRGAHMVVVGKHLVLIAEWCVLWDLSIDQAERKEREIIIPEPVLMRTTPSFLRGVEKLQRRFDNGTTVVYEAQPHDVGYLSSPNWKDEALRDRILSSFLREQARSLRATTWSIE